MRYPETFDVIVIGGGHAGVEAALASARLGVRTLLLTHNIETIGQMSCNPAIGGIGKGHLVREIDALGGVMAQAADRAGIQFRTLNARKGPAVRATRAQADRALYRAAIRQFVDTQPHLQCLQQAAADLIVHGEGVHGVVTEMGVEIMAPQVVLATGTFLGGTIHVGDRRSSGGRAGDPASGALAQRLRELDLPIGRLKTGTPPRLDTRSLDYSVMGEQPGDDPRPVFSFIGHRGQHPPQCSCHITYTNPRTHAIIADSIHRSAMYSGEIEGTGPRYCPSIEDKITRFAERERHQIFVEPEGLHSNEVYPNGLSTSLPFDVQIDYIRSIAGFERAQITRPGYAIEYDFFDPRALSPTLATRALQGLYFAGQINGTTGYEEAAAQGLLAGVNAARAARAQSPWYPQRHQAYLGVMVDDLITSGASEPYRMFTSRAEHRLSLREDNADLRLTAEGRELGLIDETRWRLFNTRVESIECERQRLRETWFRPTQHTQEAQRTILGEVLDKDASLETLLRRPQFGYRQLMQLDDEAPEIADDIALQVEVQVKYSGYIERQQHEVDKARRHGDTVLPETLDYALVQGLSNEVRQKLSEQRPPTIGHAGRISGVTPAAVSILLIHLKKHGAYARSA